MKRGRGIRSKIGYISLSGLVRKHGLKVDIDMLVFMFSVAENIVLFIG